MTSVHEYALVRTMRASTSSARRNQHPEWLWLEHRTRLQDGGKKREEPDGGNPGHGPCRPQRSCQEQDDDSRPDDRHGVES